MSLTHPDSPRKLYAKYPNRGSELPLDLKNKLFNFKFNKNIKKNKPGFGFSDLGVSAIVLVIKDLYPEKGTLGWGLSFVQKEGCDSC